MPAGVHLARAPRTNRGLPLNSVTRQGVHVGAQADRQPFAAATADDADDAGLAMPVTTRRSELAQLLATKADVLVLLISRARMAVDVAAPPRVTSSCSSGRRGSRSAFWGSPGVGDNRLTGEV